MKLARDTIVLVLDGSQFMLLRNEGDTIKPELAVIENHKTDSLSNRDLLADAPGVGFSRMGHGRDTYDKADPHQESEDRFAAEAAEVLARAMAAERGDLIVAASARALGVLRKHYDPAVKKRLIAEIAKDLTNHPVDEITKVIMAQ